MKGSVVLPLGETSGVGSEPDLKVVTVKGGALVASRPKMI